MRRTVVLGSAGAGKTTLAREISGRTGIPVVHLDVLFWQRGWVPVPPDEAAERLAAAVARDCWILDGNFLADQAGGRDERFSRADTVIFLDRTRITCLWRVLKRQAVDRRAARPDLPEGCAESFDLALLRWIWRYPRADRPRVLRLLAGLDGGISVYHLRSRGDVQRFLDTLTLTRARPERDATGASDACNAPRHVE